MKDEVVDKVLNTPCAKSGFLESHEPRPRHPGHTPCWKAMNRGAGRRSACEDFAVVTILVIKPME